VKSAKNTGVIEDLAYSDICHLGFRDRPIRPLWHLSETEILFSLGGFTPFLGIRHHQHLIRVTIQLAAG
jgi:hypothetical protein